MNLDEIKTRLGEIEDRFAKEVVVAFAGFERDGRTLELHLSRQLYRNLKKARRWKWKGFLTTLQNAEYGFDEQDARSRGGKDGIFLLDRDHKPANEMIRRIFSGYLDKPGSEADEVARKFGCERSELVAVRLVSHQMRLLGVLLKAENADRLCLVDFDHSK